MRCERTRRPTLLLALLAALVVALALPATGQAADRGNSESAGVLAPGAGYGTDGGSPDVRALQRRLRTLGTRPGPIDGLYGPLTESAVARFQQRHGLAADGIVGRQTRRQLTHPGNLERKSPAPQAGAESAESSARPAPADAPTRAVPEPPKRAAPETTAVPSRAAPDTSEGVSPEVVALLAALAALMLLAGLWRRREASVNFGLVCAALLGTFGIGAAVGALFASEAAPDRVDHATAQTGVLLAKTAKADRVRTERTAPKRVVRAKPRQRLAANQTPSTSVSSSTSTPTPAAPAPAPLAAATAAPPPPTVAAPVATRIRVPTYVVKPGDSLSHIARTKLGAGSSTEQLAAAVEKLTQLNVPSRIRSGDPNVLEAGEELMLP